MTRRNNGFVLPLIVVVVVILAALAVGSLMAAYGARLRAVKTKCETEAMLAAEAGYEQAIFWMGQQLDIVSALQNGASGSSGAINFDPSRCDYSVDFYDYIGARPVFRILATGYSGASKRVVDTYVVQAITGWAMGKCRIPSGPSSTNPVYFADGEIIDMLLHINDLRDSPDNRDIYITGNPHFLQRVEMGESRNAQGGGDKYNSVIGLFEDGINFDQPDVRITDEAAVTTKVERFRNSTNPAYRFTPVGTANVSRPRSAVQLEFFVEGGVGKVRINNNCTINGYSGGTRDYEIVPGSGGNTFRKYDIYAYHYAPEDQTGLIIPIEDTYVRQRFGSKESDPGGQIYVDGDVIIGSAGYDQMLVKGKVTVVATGNIRIADPIVVDGPRDAAGMPSPQNPNVLGLIAKGVVKVADPGMSSSASPAGAPAATVLDKNNSSKRHSYRAVCNPRSGNEGRWLPDTTTVEAAVTVGGGGWGAENVGGRREYSGDQDFLVLHGAITEVVRGVVGVIDQDGYLKKYYLDKRLLEGILPGDIWFSGKYVPAPAGWHDYRPGS